MKAQRRSGTISSMVLQDGGLASDIRVIITPTLPLDITMDLRKNDAELKALIDKGIAAVLADGTFARIQQKYVGDLDIYNE